MDLFSNPMLLILLAVVALAMFGGGSFNVTEILMVLLRALKLIPEAPDPASKQVYSRYAEKAWSALRGGDLDRAKMLLDNGVQQVEGLLSAEELPAPTGIMDTIKEWLKSPMFLILLAVGAFMIFGGMDGCKKSQAEPPAQTAPIDAAPAIWHGDAMSATPAGHYEDVMRAYQSQQAAQIAPLEPADIPPALPADWVDPAGCDQSDGKQGNYAPCQPCYTSHQSHQSFAFWQRGPLRRGVAAIARVRPLRRVARAVGWVFCRRR